MPLETPNNKTQKTVEPTPVSATVFAPSTVEEPKARTDSPKSDSLHTGDAVSTTENTHAYLGGESTIPGYF